MSIIIENATYLILKHILYRHTCKQNMAYIGNKQASRFFVYYT